MSADLIFETSLLDLIFALTPVAAILLISEYLWRSHRVHVETSRKLVHIGTGIVVAFWPYFLSWRVIQLLCALMLLVVLVSFKFHIFKSIHAVSRMTRGEILYPVGIAICALIQPPVWMFTIAILHLSLADGIAAIIGVKHGRKNKYSMFGHGKSVAGSVAFFICSLVIFAVASFVLGDASLPMTLGWFAGAAFALTLIESISWYGLDDITVPVAVIVILGTLPGM